MTSGEAGYTPKLLIGSISFIESDDADVYKSARIKPLIDVRIIKRIFIIEETL